MSLSLRPLRSTLEAPNTLCAHAYLSHNVLQCIHLCSHMNSCSADYCIDHRHKDCSDIRLYLRKRVIHETELKPYTEVNTRGSYTIWRRGYFFTRKTFWKISLRIGLTLLASFARVTSHACAVEGSDKVLTDSIIHTRIAQAFVYLCTKTNQTISHSLENYHLAFRVLKIINLPLVELW